MEVIESGVKKIKLELIDMQTSIVGALESGDINQVRADAISYKLMQVYNVLDSIKKEGLV